MEQIERTEEELTQQATNLKRDGKSVRHIAEALGISPSKVFRLIRSVGNSESANEPESETFPHNNETRADDTQVDVHALELATARALETSGPEHIQQVLSRVQREQESLTPTLTAARQREAEAHTALENTTAAVLQAQDGVSKAHAEKAQQEARATLIESGIAVKMWERRLASLHPLAQRLRSTLHALEQRQQEEVRHTVLADARATLAHAQAEFLRSLDDVQAQLATVGEELGSPTAPTHLIMSLASSLQIGAVTRNPRENVKVRMLHSLPSRNRLKGDVYTTDYADGVWLTGNGHATLVNG